MKFVFYRLSYPLAVIDMATCSELSFTKHIEQNYKQKILQSIQNIPCKGYFDFKVDNGYAFLNVSRNFASYLKKVLKKEGFKLRYMIRKWKYPGINLKIV